MRISRQFGRQKAIQIVGQDGHDQIKVDFHHDSRVVAVQMEKDIWGSKVIELPLGDLVL